MDCSSVRAGAAEQFATERIVQAVLAVLEAFR